MEQSATKLHATTSLIYSAITPGRSDVLAYEDVKVNSLGAMEGDIMTCDT